ncbi:MAG: hypothetical protein ACKVS6_00305 [Planctomycetota bacterium]
MMRALLIGALSVSALLILGCAPRPAVVNETLPNRYESVKPIPAPGESLLTKAERLKDIRFFTEIGRQFVAPSRAIVVGTVKSANRLPSGPLIARIEVSNWIRTIKSGDDTVRVIIVSDRTGALEAAAQTVFLFLDKPEGETDSILPLLAAASGDPETIQLRSRWVAEDLRISELEPYARRARETKDRLMRMLQSKLSFERTAALRDTMLLIEEDGGVFEAADAPVFVRMAGQQKDRDFGLRLLDIAEMIRQRAPS